MAKETFDIVVSVNGNDEEADTIEVEVDPRLVGNVNLTVTSGGGSTSLVSAKVPFDVSEIRLDFEAAPVGSRMLQDVERDQVDENRERLENEKSKKVKKEVKKEKEGVPA